MPLRSKFHLGRLLLHWFSLSVNVLCTHEQFLSKRTSHPLPLRSIYMEMQAIPQTSSMFIVPSDFYKLLFCSSKTKPTKKMKKKPIKKKKIWKRNMLALTPIIIIIIEWMSDPMFIIYFRFNFFISHLFLLSRAKLLHISFGPYLFLSPLSVCSPSHTRWDVNH